MKHRSLSMPSANIIFYAARLIRHTFVSSCLTKMLWHKMV
jgi:hypothetical protein